MRLWWHRDTLVELLARDVARTPDDGPDWPEVVSDAVLRQDMEWLDAAGYRQPSVFIRPSAASM